MSIRTIPIRHDLSNLTDAAAEVIVNIEDQVPSSDHFSSFESLRIRVRLLTPKHEDLDLPKQVEFFRSIAISVLRAEDHDPGKLVLVCEQVTPDYEDTYGRQTEPSVVEHRLTLMSSTSFADRCKGRNWADEYIVMTLSNSKENPFDRITYRDEHVQLPPTPLIGRGKMPFAGASTIKAGVLYLHVSYWSADPQIKAALSNG